MTGPLGTLVGWFFFSDLAVVIGTVTVLWLIMPPAHRVNANAGAWLRRETTRLGRRSAAFLPLLMVFLLFRQMGEFRDPYAPLSEDLQILLGSSWGEAWIAGMLASILALWSFSISVRDRWIGRGIILVSILVLATYPGLTGHAGGVEGPLRFLSLGADILHVLAAGAWMGGLAVILNLDRRWRRAGLRDAMETVLPVLVPPFSPVAMVSVGTLALSGTFASWLHLSTPSALWTTGYGRLLLLKVFLVTGVLGLGAWNWKRLSPHLNRPHGPRSLARSAALELGLGTLVLLVTAILVRSSPLGY